MSRQQTADSRQPYKIRVKKDDIVVVRSGKYKGQSGKVIALHPKDNSVVVEGINMAKKHVKPNRQYPQGGIIDLTRPINVSKVAIFEPTSKKPSRISYAFDKSGKKIRIYQRTGKEIK